MSGVFLPLSLIAIVAYLIGAIPFGYLIARAKGVDIFKTGSGNIGATNVGRVLGKRFGILVFLLDFAKGFLPTLAALQLAQSLHAGLFPEWAGVTAGLAAFLGHLFPVYLGFRGGKGVATGAGVVSVLVPVPALGAFFVWVVVLAVSRYVSLASLTAVIMLCAMHIVLTPKPLERPKDVLTGFCVVAAGLVALRHRGNIGRLLAGNENKIKESPAMSSFARVLHLLSLGLWFGSNVFFSFVAAPLIFATYEGLATGNTPRPHFLPETMTRENGSQLAGLAVGPIFPYYFVLQGICGFLALVTAREWSKSLDGKLNRRRFLVLLLACISLLIAWPLSNKVSELRGGRFDPDTVKAAAAKAAFATWHLYSLLMNFVTLGFVTAALVLAAWLPRPSPSAATSDA